MPLRVLVTVCFLISGATGLVYQVVWVRLIGQVVGVSSLAISAVVATFLLGLGLGARVAGRVAGRVSRPLFAYGLLELGIGAMALAVPHLLSVLGTVYAPFGLGALHLPATFALALVLLLPPTLAMGATLPLLTRWYAQDPATLGHDTGWLYAVNTTGAVAGAALAGFVLLPGLGQPLTIQLAAGANMVVGGVAALVGLRVALAPRRAVIHQPAAAQVPSADRRVLLAFALSGGAAMVQQVTWSRSFELFTGSTTYAFSLIVCAFIAGLAIGGHLMSHVVDRLRAPAAVLGWVNVGIACAGASLIPVIGELPVWMVEPLAARADSFVATQLFVLSCLAVLVLLPTVLMGATYPLAIRALVTDPARAPDTVGRAYSWNTIGAVLGSAGAGLLLVPALGLQDTLWLAVALNLVGAAVLLGPTGSRLARCLAWTLPALGLAGILLAPDWNPRRMNLAPWLYASDLVDNPALLHQTLESGSLVYHQEGRGATVTAIRRSTGSLVLRVNGKTDASTYEDRMTQGTMGVLGPLLSEGRERVLMIGLGSGMSAAAALDHQIEHLTVAELLPEVAGAAKAFGPDLGMPLDDPRIDLRLVDGRQLLLYDDTRYDVIVSQPTNLFVSGMSGLFTVETFAAMSDRLAPGGVALVWCQGYLLGQEEFQTIVRSFVEVFPHATLWQGDPFDLILVAGTAPLVMDADRLAERVRGLSGSRAERWAALSSVADLQRYYLMGPDALRALGGAGTLHHDADPFLEFTAPRALYDDSLSLDLGALFAARERLPLTGAAATLEAELDVRLAAARGVERALASDDLADLDAAFALDPAHPRLREQRSLALFRAGASSLQAGQLDRALALAEESVLMAPERLPTWDLLARARASEAGDLTLSVRTLEAAVVVHAANPYAWLELARSRAAAGDREGARLAFDEAVALDPKLPELQSL